MKTICIHCGKTEEEHHAFEGFKMPKGCKCDYRDWGYSKPIPEVCSKWNPEIFKGKETGLCETCEHLKECHSNDR